MKRTLLIVIIGVIATPAFADSDCLTVNGPAIELRYDVGTGKIAPVTLESRRLGRPVWLCTGSSGYYWARQEGDCPLDWGDVRGGVTIGTVCFDESTNSQAADGDNCMYVAVFQNDDGWGDSRKQIRALYRIENIPGSSLPPDQSSRTVWTVQPQTPFVIDGDDLDNDGLDDFSYAFHYATIRTPNATMGPSLVNVPDPNRAPPSCPGITNVFDLYLNPDWANDPNLATTYEASYWLSGDPFLQFYFAMYAPACPTPGASGRYCLGDIGDFDCTVDLADLGVLLAHFGQSNVWYGDGDIYPPDEYAPGDGVVDLADLAEMLAQYGDDCR